MYCWNDSSKKLNISCGIIYIIVKAGLVTTLRKLQTLMSKIYIRKLSKLSSANFSEYFAKMSNFFKRCGNLFIQPRKPGSLPTHGAAEKTLVGAGHVILSKIHYLMGWGKYEIASFHIQDASTYK